MFRLFCGFSRSEPPTERTAFVRFRRNLVAHGLDKALFETITQRLKARAIRGPSPEATTWRLSKARPLYV
jgi:IS5 family transposase